MLGDKEAQDDFRAKNTNKHHCAWLRRDPNACEALPAGIDGTEAGITCPHNVYANNSEIFSNRDAVIDTIERIFRLVNSSEVGIVSEATLDPLSVTELLTAKGELDRQQAARHERESEKSRLEAQSNKSKGPSIATHGSNLGR